MKSVVSGFVLVMFFVEGKVRLMVMIKICRCIWFSGFSTVDVQAGKSVICYWCAVDLVFGGGDGLSMKRLVVRCREDDKVMLSWSLVQ